MTCDLSTLRERGTHWWHQTVLFTGTGLAFGLILAFSILEYIPPFTAGIAFIAAALPMVLVWHAHAKKIFVGILVLSMTFIVDRTFNLHPEHMGGAKGFIVSLRDIALCFALFVSFVESMHRKQMRVKFFPRFLLPLIGLLVMAVLSMGKAVFVSYSVYEFIEIVKAVITFLYIANYTARDENYKYVIGFVLIGLGLEVIFVLLELVGSIHITALGSRSAEYAADMRQDAYYRVGGTLGGANPLAWYLDFVLPLALGMVFYKVRSIPRAFMVLLFCSGLAVLILTFSRGGWAGFIVSAMMIWFYYMRHSSTLKKILVVIITLTIIGGGILIVSTTDNAVKTRLTEDDKGSAYVRIPLMEVAISIIKVNPVFGVGLNNYTVVYHQYDYGVDKITYYYPVPVHNFFLQLAAETGIAGMAFFILFIILVAIAGIRYSLTYTGRSAWAAFSIVAGSAGFFLQGLVENTSLGSYNMYPLWIMYGLLAGITAREHKPGETDEP